MCGEGLLCLKPLLRADFLPWVFRYVMRGFAMEGKNLDTSIQAKKNDLFVLLRLIFFIGNMCLRHRLTTLPCFSNRE